ncbi:MAG: glycoside hydrolase family 99-like domain-containing protein [Clostridiales bacterium]|nr:glycoside hydrolase family 99-like domain-containing protein [Clostridiales bacterium]
MARKYDVAAYVWPAYTGNEPRSRMFWPQGIGEWETVKAAGPKFEGHGWPRRPLWGYVNEADPYVMEMEIEAAADHNVNVFIYDWYWYDRRPFLEQCLNDGFLGAKNNRKMKFFLMWANHSANCYWDIRLSSGPETVIWDGAVDLAETKRVFARVIGKYFSHPSYYRIDGAPVFMIYDVANLCRGLGGLEGARRALELFREMCVQAGFPGLHLQLCMYSDRNFNLSGMDGGKPATTGAIIRDLRFDSLSHYQFVHFTSVSRDYMEIVADAQKEWERIDRAYSQPYFPHISVGWDNNPRFHALRPSIVAGNTPERFEQALRMAKDYVDAHPGQPPLLTVNSWNEWTETSYLQPDDVYGYGYLDAVKRVFG